MILLKIMIVFDDDQGYKKLIMIENDNDQLFLKRSYSWSKDHDLSSWSTTLERSGLRKILKRMVTITLTHGNASLT